MDRKNDLFHGASYQKRRSWTKAGAWCRPRDRSCNIAGNGDPTIDPLWVGAIDREDRKYWTQISPIAASEPVPFELRLPLEETVILRYFRDFGDDGAEGSGFIRGYYSPGGTVLTMAEAATIGPRDPGGPYVLRVLPLDAHPGYRRVVEAEK
jgi:hypothetical protein